MRGRKVAIFGVFTALALIFSYVELLIPINFGIPGAKLGLANLMTVLVLYKMGIKEALALSVTRIIYRASCSEICLVFYIVYQEDF